MAEQPSYRHELKYEIDPGVRLALESRLRAVMRPDPHAGMDGRYTIRSIYFDNYRDKALREKVDGVQQREKFRIRWYNDDLSRLSLEKKIKHNDLCLKCAAPLTEGELRALLAGDTAWMGESPHPLVQELFCKMRTQQLRPRVTVSYTRQPLIYPPGNVRVTFDSDIRTSLWSPDLLTGGPKAPAVDAPGRTVLEVKYDAFLPEIIALLLQSEGVRRGAFSKYGSCRKFG